MQIKGDKLFQFSEGKIETLRGNLPDQSYLEMWPWLEVKSWNFNSYYFAFPFSMFVRKKKKTTLGIRVVRVGKEEIVTKEKNKDYIFVHKQKLFRIIKLGLFRWILIDL